MFNYHFTATLALSLALSFCAPFAEAARWIEKESARSTIVDNDANEGTAITISGDVLIVGAPGLDRPAGEFGIPPAVPNAGGVHVFHRRIGGWTLDQTLFSPDAASGARFGASVALDGDVLVVGEPDYTPETIPAAMHNGRALVFVRSPSTGHFVFRRQIFRLGLTVGASTRRPQYGTSVDVAAGIAREYAVAVGAPGEDGIDNGNSGSVDPDIGAVLVTRLHTTTDGDIAEADPTDSSWYVLNQTLEGGVAGTHYRAVAYKAFFGESIALLRFDCPSDECDNKFWLGVGAPNANLTIGDGSFNTTVSAHGAAQLFGIESFLEGTSPSDVWRQQQYVHVDASHSLYLPFFINSLTTANKADQHLGSAIDLRLADPTSTDWRDVEMIVGAENAASASGATRTGGAFYFRVYPDDCCWRGVQSLYDPDGAAGDRFGADVAFAGERLLVSSPDREDGDLFVTEGAVFAYEQRDADTWADWTVFTSDVPLDGAISGSSDWIVAGAPYLHGQTQTWQRGWLLEVASPVHGVIQILPPIYGLSPAVVCPPDCSVEFENGRHIYPAAIPEDAYVLHHWSAPGTECNGETSQSCSLVVDADTQLAASFVLNVGNTRNVTLGIAAGSGKIRLHADTDVEIVCPDQCGGIFPNGTLLSLSAEPDPGFEFAEWTGPCAFSTTATCQFTLNTTTQLSAAFRPIDGNRVAAVSFVGGGPGLITIVHSTGELACDSNAPTCSVSLPSDSTIELFACTTSGGKFSAWGGDCSGAESCHLTLDTDKEIIATFEMTDSLFVSSFEKKSCEQGWFRPAP